MTIYPKRGILYLGYRDKGKWIYKSTGLPDTKENRRKLQKFNFDVQDYDYLTPPISVCIKQFLNSKRQLKHHTVIGYEFILNDFQNCIGDICVSDITPQHIETVHQYWSRHSKNTLASYNKTLRIFFNFLVEREYIKKNIVPNIKYEPKVVRIIPDEVMDKILEKARTNPKHYRFLYFLKETGFRVGEAISLQWEDIEFENKRIVLRNTKGKRDDEFPLTDSLSEFLESFRQSSGSVFGFQNTFALSWLRKKYFLHFTFHDIRRTFATKLLANNVNPYKVMKLMRHKDFKTTMQHYTYIQTLALRDELDKVQGSKGSKSDKFIPENTGLSQNRETNVAILSQNQCTRSLIG